MENTAQLKRKRNILDYGILLLIFLFSLNFLNYSNFILIGAFIACIIRLLMVSKSPFMVNLFDFLILAFCFTYALIISAHLSEMMFWFRTYFILPVISYFIGRISYQINRRSNGLESYNIIILLSFGLFLYGILNIYYRYQKGYNLIWTVAENRMCIDFWSDKDIWPTVEAHFFLFLTALLFYFMFQVKKRVYQLIYAICLLLSVFAALDTGSRTLLVLMTAVVAFLSVAYLKSKEILWQKKSRLLRIVTAVAVCVCILYFANAFDVRNLVEDSSLYQRLTSSEVSSVIDVNGRGIRYMAVISNMPTHPFGNIDLGGDLSEGGLGSAHNTWLDVYRVAGILPFILFLWISVRVYKMLRMLIKANGLFHREVLLFTSIMLIMNLQFLTEAIFTSNMHIVQCYMIVCGLLNAAAADPGYGRVSWPDHQIRRARREISYEEGFWYIL